VLGGLDDGAYPRLGVVDGDDAPARDPPIDAIGAATDKMVITYTGARSTLASRARPRCRWWNCSRARPFDAQAKVRDRAVIKHPLRPCDNRNVTPGALGVPDEPLTFDPAAITAAKLASGRRVLRLIPIALPSPLTSNYG
jgi:exodeoxyribonuclease V gamma subunit